MTPPSASGAAADHAALRGLRVFERGWLSSNNVFIDDPAGAVLVDSGHVVHAEQTVALVRHALDTSPHRERAAPLRVFNTHLHSDHCGGNASLQRAFGAQVSIPPWQARAVAGWDADALGHRPTGQRCERFSAAGTLEPGQVLRPGGRAWEVIAAPGHDPDSVMLFDSTEGLLLSADALWENGFGVVFPEIEPHGTTAGVRSAFDDVAEVLDTIERLPVACVVPGHGAPFADVAEALARARRRLAAWRAEPARHLRYAAKVLVKYHLMEEGSQAIDALRDWASETPFVVGLRERAVAPHEHEAWLDALLLELRDGGAIDWRDGRVFNR